jgi:glycosyltransferase involved in cell wall biosynthesis
MIPVHVRVFYPADPLGVVPGGVDTFLRGILKYAPEDFKFSLVGMTTDPVARPVGQWTSCQLGRNEFDFFPAVQVNDAGQRSRLPLSLRYTAAIAWRMGELRSNFDVFEFHRIEPALLFLRDPRPKNAFFHQDMAVIRSDKADIVWRYMPWLYFSIERRVLHALSSAWCVRQEGVRAMRERHPHKADAIRFVPTWVDTAVFSPLDETSRQMQRLELALELGIDVKSAWVVSVGRLDSQKDPALLLDAVARLADEDIDLTWLVVGDGVLRASLEQRVASAGIGARVRFLGLMAPTRIAELLRLADVFALSSAYEGMPMAVLEALGSGVPVATTDVGEVRQVVKPGINGEIADSRTVQDFAACLGAVIAQRANLRGSPAVQAIQAFQPEQVLRPVFANYRQLAGRLDGAEPAALPSTLKSK